ncbi:hypothetical protein CDAR_404011 [Caerostris darwini]|uniref:Uncharacterized protein n=1 Tax=Caerostris darwini TaxID=1538125 RepID=A0AAV4SR75_9ARAC|nr:hypothetical protein CDAR_404011 [Caerostris darwini]
MDWRNLFIFFAFMGVVSGTKVRLLTAIGICGQKLQEIAGESKDLVHSCFKGRVLLQEGGQGLWRGKQRMG